MVGCPTVVTPWREPPGKEKTVPPYATLTVAHNTTKRR
jgi:hypothetical protein